MAIDSVLGAQIPVVFDDSWHRRRRYHGDRCRFDLDRHAAVDRFDRRGIRHEQYLRLSSLDRALARATATNATANR